MCMSAAVAQGIRQLMCFWPALDYVSFHCPVLYSLTLLAAAMLFICMSCAYKLREFCMCMQYYLLL